MMNLFKTEHHFPESPYHEVDRQVKAEQIGSNTIFFKFLPLFVFHVCSAVQR